ncbi:MAG: endonuclease/exonuclease/phosphatase family protein [Verrucomicrobiota bacterium]
MKYFSLMVFAFLSTGCTSVQTNAPTIRVLTYNIHHGEGNDQKIDLVRIAEIIKREKADIVALQEVDRGVERSARQDQPAELAKLTGMKVYFARNIIYQGGDYGNAVLTRFPIQSKKNTHYRMLRTNEQRGVLQLLLDVHGKDLLFMNTHIDYRPDDAERFLNADELQGIVVAAKKTPIILCGDFNTEPESRTHSKIKTFLSDSWEVIGEGNGFSFSSEKPQKRIDYIWISPESVTPLKIKVLSSDASDHLPVLGEFRLK